MWLYNTFTTRSTSFTYMLLSSSTIFIYVISVPLPMRKTLSWTTCTRFSPCSTICFAKMRCSDLSILLRIKIFIHPTKSIFYTTKIFLLSSICIFSSFFLKSITITFSTIYVSPHTSFYNTKNTLKEGTFS